MPKTKQLDPGMQGRVLQADYDAIIGNEDECRVCLTKGEIDWILSQADYAGWATRWKSTGSIDLEQITRFQGNLILRLLVACQPCLGEDDVYELRQNPSEPCQLEQSVDGGLTWTLAFDYRLCLFDEMLNPPEQRIDPVTGNLQYSVDDGVTWVDAPLPSDKTPLKTDIFADKTDPACYHAANATELIRRMVMDSGDDMLIILEFIVNILLIIITGGNALPIIITNLIGAVIAFGLATIRGYMVQAEWDRLLRILYCHHDAAWGWTPTGWDAALDQIGAEYPPGVALFLGGLIQTMGSIGLTNAGYLALVTDPDCSAIQCGDLDCGFTTNSSGLNWTLWSVGEEVVNPTIFNQPISTVIRNGSPVMQGGTSQLLVAYTTFAQECYITQVDLYTLGRANPSSILVAYRAVENGEWIEAGTQQPSSWAAGVAKSFPVNRPVWGIQVQSKAQNTGQNNFNTVIIGDPTP